MGRRPLIEDDDLLARLGGVFRDVGYEGATLAMLAAATGLQKASLYHRFPGGKEQMAREVLVDAGAWLERNILAPLREQGDPALRIAAMVQRLDEFYSGGRQACLLNMLSSGRIADGPFTGLIRDVFEAWVGALTAVLIDAGIDRKAARRRADRAIMMLHGSLVFARGVGTTRPFRNFLKSLPEELLGATISPASRNAPNSF
jgi:AcrR family transcriptional regulator